MHQCDGGRTHPANEELLPLFAAYPSIQQQYDLLREEVADMREQWHEGTMTLPNFEIYRAKLGMLMIMKMWSWNYYAEENWIRDEEINAWFTEAANVGE